MKINQEVRDGFEFFQELMSEPKEIEHSTIILEPKQNNVHWLVGNSKVRHSNVEDELTLTVEKSKREKKYGIKLKCKALTSEPIVRFDSDGPAHRNSNPELHLLDQVVTTPHFNTFDSGGRRIAYKTENLVNEKESEIIANDINFGLSHFCSETKCQLTDGNFPNIEDRILEIEFQNQDNFEFKGVRFE